METNVVSEALWISHYFSIMLRLHRNRILGNMRYGYRTIAKSRLAEGHNCW